jgi:uncharacterized YccA/Bax inhibitor family protein
MALFRNPALNSKTFSPLAATAEPLAERMTIAGTVNKTGILLLCVVATAVWSWTRIYAQPEMIGTLALGGAIGGFIFALVTIFKKEWSPVTAPIYSLLEGLVLGSLSALLEQRFPGIAMQAVGLTFGTLVVMLVAYRAGVIRATERFKMGVVAATGGIALFYVVTLILGFFGVRVPAVYSAGPWGIAISVVIVIVAALNLVLDFDFIENGARLGAPHYMEWYGAFGLMVTLIWLYMEILRLLAKVRGRR